MIYSEAKTPNTIRLQKESGRYCTGLHHFTIHYEKYPMNLNFIQNKPLGPTLLVEWSE
jgi:hypothetical protein